MKLKWYLLILPVFILITGCSKDDPEIDPPVKNLPPSTPLLNLPEENAYCTQPGINFIWNPASDPENDPITYTIELSTDPYFNNITGVKSTGVLSASLGLERGKVYYWRVQAQDNKNNKSKFSKVRSLYTEPEPSLNSIPFQPVMLLPQNGSKGLDKTVLLEWNASDPDGDALKFDLYLGTENPPQLFKADLQENKITVDLDPKKTYYWRVEVKDSAGAKAIGEVWRFETR